MDADCTMHHAARVTETSGGITTQRDASNGCAVGIECTHPRDAWNGEIEQRRENNYLSFESNNVGGLRRPLKAEATAASSGYATPSLSVNVQA